jgi:hypothetical protein
MAKPMWWVGAIGSAIAHFAFLVGTIIYCLDHYYEQPCPLDLLGKVLISPAYFFLPLLGNTPLVLVLLPLNSFFWGCALVEPIRWWCGWPPWRFSLRTLLIAFTVIAVLLALRGVANQHAETPILPVVQPCCG